MHSATEAKTEYATSAVHSNAMHVTSASSNIGTPNQFMLMLYFHLHFYEEKKNGFVFKPFEYFIYHKILRIESNEHDHGTRERERVSMPAYSSGKYGISFSVGL